MFAVLLLVAAALVAGAGLLIYYPARASAADRPNIVVIMSDDQDVDSIPVMRRLLANPEGSWFNFSNAFANTSICTPARGTLLTGQYAHNHGAVGNNWGDQLDDSNTLAVWLDDAGYNTAVIGKYLHSYPEETPGYGEGLYPGWDRFMMNENSVGGHTRQAVDFITDSNSPFFLWLAYRAPHIPASPPERYATANAYVPPDRPNFNEADVTDKPAHIRKLSRLTEAQIAALRAERLNSQRELLAIDDAIVEIIDTLEAEGQLDNTLVIFVGDNGFSWGAHLAYEKLCPYEECSRVPLFIRYPGLPANRTEDAYVSMVDLAATIADYADVTPGLPQDGRSLLPLLSGDAWSRPDAVLIEKAYGTVGYYAARVPGWAYVEYKTGDKELYDMAADPFQLNNLAGKAAYATTQAWMKTLLADLKAGTPPAPTPTPTPSPSPTPTATPTPTPPPPGDQTLTFSWPAAVVAGGVAVAPEDIAAYDPATGAWSLFFDGSAAGLTANINGFEVMPDGSLLLTVDVPATLPGVGAVDDSDIVRFVPGAAAFEMVFDGSDVGLSTNAEDIDAIGLLPGGDLILSTRGKAAVGVAATPHDLLRFTPTQLGATTEGTWSVYFDGSDVGLSTTAENLTGVSVGAGGRLYLNTLGAFKVPGLSGGPSDVFSCAPLSLGRVTSCDFSAGFFWRGAALGLDAVGPDAFAMGD